MQPPRRTGDTGSSLTGRKLPWNEEDENIGVGAAAGVLGRGRAATLRCSLNIMKNAMEEHQACSRVGPARHPRCGLFTSPDGRPIVGFAIWVYCGNEGRLALHHEEQPRLGFACTYGVTSLRRQCM
jgi:hypothetical protein